MITSPPPAAAADSEDPDRGGGGGLRAEAVGFSPEIGAAIDNRARGANVAVTWYTLRVHTYIHVQFIYTRVQYYMPRGGRIATRAASVPPIIRARPCHLRSHLRTVGLRR